MTPTANQRFDLRSSSHLVLACGAALLTQDCFAQSRHATGNDYTIRSIQLVAPSLGGEATAIDNDGLVAGTSGTVTGYRANRAGTKPLPDAVSGFNSTASGIGPRGQLLGSARSQSGWNHAAVWVAPNSAATALTLLPPAAGDLFADARGMSIGGVVVGITDDGLIQKASAR